MKQRRRGNGDRPQLIWEDSIKWNVRKAEEDDKWRETAVDREKWNGITAGVVQQYMN